MNAVKFFFTIFLAFGFLIAALNLVLLPFGNLGMVGSSGAMPSLALASNAFDSNKYASRKILA